MTTSTSPNYTAEHTALVLAQLSQKLCRSDRDDRVWDKFHDALTFTLSQRDPVESQILHSAIRALLANEDDEAYTWLLHQVEKESELQLLPHPRTNREYACVLFAIPVVAPMLTPISGLVYADTAFEDLHDILEGAEIFDTQATTRLLPRLFSPEELRGRSKSEIRALTRSLAQQVLEDSTTILELEDGVFTGTPGILEDLTVYDFAQLHYLVGITVTPSEFLNDLIPEILPPSKEVQDDVIKSKTSTPGWLKDGSWWSQSFCESLEDVLHVLDGGFSLGAPQGWHDDMRSGLVLLREQNGQCCIEDQLEIHELTTDDVVVEEWPLSTPNGDVVGLTVYIVNAKDENLLYARIVWPKFHHEDLDETIDALHDVLTVMEMAPADELLSSDSTAASYLLH